MKRRYELLSGASQVRTRRITSVQCDEPTDEPEVAMEPLQMVATLGDPGYPKRYAPEMIANGSIGGNVLLRDYVTFFSV